MSERAKVLVVGKGGREHALVEKYAQSPHVSEVLVVPGNHFMGMGVNKPVRVFPEIDFSDAEKVLSICEKHGVQLVDVASDRAVANGLVNYLRSKGISAFGPTSQSGRIESSKAWARWFGSKYGIPQPDFYAFTSRVAGLRHLREYPLDKPWFIKVSGLADGKGALPAENYQEAEKRVKELERFGNASKMFLIEEWLRNKDGTTGQEFSAFALCDGKEHTFLGSALDYKRKKDADKGENTGGMGCFTPVPFLTEKLYRQVGDIFSKVTDGMQKEGRPYKGILYLGGMIVNNKVFVIEFNARWGDPEAQVLLPSFLNDWYETSHAVITGDISNVEIKRDQLFRISVAATLRGYPGNFSEELGKPIQGLDVVMRMPGVRVYGAGITGGIDGWYTNGGRVVHLVGEGENLIQARARVYAAMPHLRFGVCMPAYRTDIGEKFIV